MTSKNQLLSQTVQNSHATIVEIPRGYGFDFAKKQIEFPADSNILDFFPTIHDKQKTEIINVDDIEDLRGKLRGKSKKLQYIVFFDAEKMNEAAQNKFLKLLEEPRANLRFVLLVNSAETLLATVRSRAQKVQIAPISNEESQEILAKFSKLDEEKKRKILFLASGLPAEIKRLASEKKYFDGVSKTMEISKKWLTGNDFEKLKIAADFKNDRVAVLDFLERTIQVVRISTTEVNARKNAEKLRKLLSAHKRISKNANLKAEFLLLILK